MKTYEEIKSIIQSIPNPDAGFNLVEVDSYLWGKSSSGEIAFGFNSKNGIITPLKQTTKHLKLFINHVFKISINELNEERKISLLVLKDPDDKSVDIFVRLCLSMSDGLNEEKLLKHFLELKDLFSNEKRISKTELEGMFGELFAMYVLKINYGVDISIYYQKEDRRKFDFSISDKKKIEVKATIKPERIHHFLQQQLDTDRYDIKVMSLMLQYDDEGMSLLDLITECKDLFSSNLVLIIHIETMIKNCSSEELSSLRFNYDYAKANFKIYDATNIPRLREKNEEGVFNVEYDSDLTNSSSMSPSKLIDWIK